MGKRTYMITDMEKTIVFQFSDTAEITHNGQATMNMSDIPMTE